MLPIPAPANNPNKHGRENVIFSKGFIYRWGQRIKEAGERMGHISLFGIHIFNWLFGLVINLGLWIRDSAGSYPIGEN